MTYIWERVLKYFCYVHFNLNNIEPDATLTHVQLITHVEKEHNVRIPEEDQYVHALQDMQAIHTLDVFEVIQQPGL